MKKQHKALIVNALAIFGLAFFVSGVQAQENEIKIVEAPKIYVEKVTLDPVDENANKITGKFNILSQENKNYNDIYYEVNLYNVVQKTSVLDDVQLYNPENWRAVIFSPNQNPLIVQANESKDINFSVNVPDNKPSGDYIVEIQLYQKDVTPLGKNRSSVLKLSGNNKFINIDNTNAFVLRGGGSYAPGMGIDFSQDENPAVSVVFQNIGDSEINFYPKITTYDRNQFSGILSETKGDALNIKGGDAKNMDIAIQKVGKPGSFLAMVQLLNAGDNKPVSAPIYFRFVVRGESGRILELLADKISYNKGDTMKISATVIGSADSFIRDGRGNLIENSKTLNAEKGMLKISVMDVDNKEIYSGSKEVSLSGDSETANFEVQLEKNLPSYKIKATLEKSGKVLNEKTVESINKEAKTNNKWDIIKIILIIIVLLPIIIFIASKLKSRFALILAIMFASVFLASSASAALTISWAQPSNNHHYNWDSATCTRGANSQIRSSGTISSDICQNQGGETFTATTYVDGTQRCSAAATISTSYSSGWSCNTLGGVENYSVGSHTIRTRITSSTGGVPFDQTRTFYVDDNGGCIDVQTRWNDGGTLRGLSGATGAVTGRSCTTDSGGHCMMAPYQPISTTVTASKSGYVTQSKTTTVSSGIGYASFVLAPPAGPVCGDGTCGPATETCDNCPQDCGTCPPPAPTCDSRYWSPSPVNVGSGSSFYWTSTNATSASLSCTGPNPLSATSVNVDGNRNFSSFSTAGTETCTITFTNATGSVSCSSNLTISNPAPTCTNRYWSPAGPLAPPANSTFYWTSANATSATLNCSGITSRSKSVAVSGNEPFTSLGLGTETCSVSLSGPGGTASCPNTSLTVATLAASCTTRYWSPAGPLTAPADSTFYWQSADASGATLTCSGPVSLSSVAVAVNGNRAFTALGAGTETCRVDFTGTGGPGSCANRSLTINAAANNPPTAWITEPAGPTTIVQGTTINFAGNGTDTDGTVVASEWREGSCGAMGTLLGSGVGPNASLSNSTFTVGTHIVYLRVQDDDGAWSSNCPSRAITVNSASAPIVTLDAVPDIIKLLPGEILPKNFNMTWSVTGTATLCTADCSDAIGGPANCGGWSWTRSVPPTGGSESVALTGPFVKYVLSCTGPGGTGNAEKNVMSVCYDSACSGSTCSDSGAPKQTGTYNCSQACTQDSDCSSSNDIKWKEVNP